MILVNERFSMPGEMQMGQKIKVENRRTNPWLPVLEIGSMIQAPGRRIERLPQPIADNAVALLDQGISDHRRTVDAVACAPGPASATGTASTARAARATGTARSAEDTCTTRSA